ncbi:hypothetical protein F4604DRAFT_1918544 [Suillus subluteus]|nr:hypothetical protein F4604DRAFT_1918544 [Suillus subluteus]
MGDSSAICQHALCALSDVYRFHNLYSLFSDHDISSLLAEVLNITHSRRLPILNSAKVFSLALWILGSQRLPQSLLSSQTSDIVSTALRFESDFSRYEYLLTKCVGRTPPFGILPNNVLRSCNSAAAFDPLVFAMNSYAVRLQAALVLGRMVLSLLDSSFDISLDHCKVISDFVLDFMDKQWPQTTSTHISELHHIAKAAIAMEEQSELVERPVWLLSTMSSLVILPNHCLFSHSDTFKCFMQLAVLGFTHVRSVVRGWLNASSHALLLRLQGYLTKACEPKKLSFSSLTESF